MPSMQKAKECLAAFSNGSCNSDKENAGKTIEGSFPRNARREISLIGGKWSSIGNSTQAQHHICPFAPEVRKGPGNLNRIPLNPDHICETASTGTCSRTVR